MAPRTALERPDRRTRKTRASLHAAMRELLSQQDYGTITVAELIEHADIARATFYAHYADRDDLFRDVVAELTDTLIERAVAVVTIDTAVVGGAAVYEMFRHAERYSHIYLAMLHGAAGGTAIHHFRSAIEATYSELMRAQETAFGLEPRLPLEFVVRAWVGEHLALIGWWLEERPPYSAADMTRMRLRLMTDGPLWARGLAPGQVVFDEQEFERVVQRAEQRSE